MADPKSKPIPKPLLLAKFCNDNELRPVSKKLSMYLCKTSGIFLIW